MSRPSPRLFALLCALLVSQVEALPDDRNQPIRITADQALRDEKRGTTVYSGNVVMDQGSLHIEADRITIYRIVEDADKIVAEGDPVYMEQQPEPEKPLMRARARIIEYYKTEDRVHMRKDARIEQDGATVSGNTIDYFIEQQLVKADSLSDQAGDRVEVLIPAGSISESEDSSGTAQGE
ncbi:MAG: lipopolysaccharide transport periplasmic protein LptA [Pseudomonadota bacterium]